MMQLDLFGEIIPKPQPLVRVKEGDMIRIKDGVVESYESKQEWESYYYLLDAKGVGIVNKVCDTYCIAMFGKLDLYITFEELEVV